jgi:DNA modification methylase
MNADQERKRGELLMSVDHRYEQYVREFRPEREYGDFIDSKLPDASASGIECGNLHPSLMPFHKAIVKWAVRRGRCAIFANTGLWKTSMQIEWARHVSPNGRRLIVAPLGVVSQTIKLGMDRLNILLRNAAGSEHVRGKGVYITNYEKLHRFDPSLFSAVVLDESSILKSITGATRNKLVDDWTGIPHRLCCTATPAPNDLEELANHAEFLGVMKRRDMLATFFVHDDQHWRIKGHAHEAFYKWLATWAVYVRRPSDLGFSDKGFELPELRIHEEQVEVNDGPSGDRLFAKMGRGVQGRQQSRRASLDARVEKAVQLIRSKPGKWLIWCGLNDEGRKLAERLGKSAALIEGPDKPEIKLERERKWRESGIYSELITKLSIFGFGMNWQHCHQMLFLGLGDSWEQYFQGLRRCWRFGQKHEVDAWIVTSTAEKEVVQNVWRKEREAEETAANAIEHMKDMERIEVCVEDRPPDEYIQDEQHGAGWTMMLGDCCQRLKELPSSSVGLSLHSPPFAQLYTYSASLHDMGNCRDYHEFFEHYRYAVRELLRVTKPGRRACVHVQQIAMTKVMQGIIAWRDFRGDVMRLYVDAGWIYHGEVVIDKCPQAQAIRTKSKTLLFVQKDKDSSWSIPAMADYILLFRAPGENAEPIKNDVSNEEWIRWARPVWYGIRESATLQASSARTEKDEKHIAPLQLETIERCVRLWSGPGDLVLDPCSGIGSTGYVAIEHGREFVGIELKPEYWKQACANLRNARPKSHGLFSDVSNFDPDIALPFGVDDK